MIGQARRYLEVLDAIRYFVKLALFFLLLSRPRWSCCDSYAKMVVQRYLAKIDASNRLNGYFLPEQKDNVRMQLVRVFPYKPSQQCPRCMNRIAQNDE